MISKIITFALALVAFQAAHAQSLTHTLHLTYYDGENLTYTTPQPNLSHDPIKEICHQGSWALYSEPEFIYGTSVVVFPTVGTCADTGNPLPYKSARPVGDISDISLPAINFFSETSLQGESNVASHGFEDIDFDIRSLVALNGAEVEYFREPHYAGDSFCLAPSPSYCFYDNELCVVWRVDSLDTPWYLPDARSARIGCSPTTTKVKPKYNANLKNTNVLL